MQHARSLILFSVLLYIGKLPATTIEFNRDVRPILSENCFACHGPDKNTRQAGLRLDRPEDAIAHGAIKPNDPTGSRLVARINAEQQTLRMPPVWSDKELTPEQKIILAEWIREGAQFEKHWSYIPPKRSNDLTGSAAIDFFIDKSLAASSLQPALEADRRTLARRLSFDLLGLPPKKELVESFIHDSDSQAYEKVLTRLLDSPHFGERMAVHWLDLVRYADTVGFHGDANVNVYPFRDYVIRSFNDNKPFDQFTREQIAGDLVSNPGVDQLVASAYNRLNRITNEGGAQAKEYLAKYAADRVRTTSTVWLGSTLGCAECHDHKFDPFSAKDFYSMQAFFADIEEKGVFEGYGDWGSRIQVPSLPTRKKIDSLDGEIERFQKRGHNKLKATRTNLNRFATRLKRNMNSWVILQPDSVTPVCDDPNVEGCESFDFHSKNGLIEFERKVDRVRGLSDPRTLVAQSEIALPPSSVTSLMVEVLAVEDEENFFLVEFEARLQRDGASTAAASIKTFLPDWEAPKGMLRSTVDGNTHTGWGGKPSEDGTRRAVFIFTEPLQIQDGDKLIVTTIFDRVFGLKGFPLKYRLWAGSSDFPEIPPPATIWPTLSSNISWSKPHRQLLADTFIKQTKQNRHYLAIQKLERQRKTLIDASDECLITKAVEPREIRVLPRGNWMDTTGEVVTPQAPHFLNPIPSVKRPLTRLDLANWLIAKENPLTARVFVNRLWKMFFGTGLSKVLDDIGSQGEPPVHPELLDWLAVEFMESGWDVKHIIRTMLMSQTYRRTSEPTFALQEKDPFNRLHGRQTARRLDAEFIRDNALAVSGLLNVTIGGRSAKPYQPKDYYIDLNFPKRRYHSDRDINQFRRGLYVHWQRTYLHPAMMNFDAPTREECTAERPISNTPLQALTLLNDPSFVEAAKAFGGRILNSNRKDDVKRLDFAFREAFSRGAEQREQDVLLRLLKSQRDYFEKNPQQAKKLLSTGISLVPSHLSSVDTAAWTSVARALLNKHEFVMRY
mgnify:CR=1 FL=1